MDESSRERTRSRRLGGFALLAIGIALVLSTLGRSWPSEQTVVFRLPTTPRHTATSLELSFTRVGDREPLRGVSRQLGASHSRDIRERLKLPDGDYMVTVGITWTDTFPTGPYAPAKTETTSARRVTLNGAETLVVLDAEGLE